MSTYKILAWNAQVGRPWPDVRRQLDLWDRQHLPHFTILTECYTIVDDLRPWAREQGLNVFSDESGHPEGKDVVILADKGIRIAGSGFLRHDEPWLGPKHGNKHIGRSMPWVAPQGGPVILGVHRVAGPKMKSNQKARAVERDILVNYLGRLPARFIAAGDWNETYWSGGRGFAKAVHGTYYRGHSVDNAVARGYSLKAKRLGTGGSDHEAILWVASSK